MDVQETVQAYGASWNEPDEAARRKQLEGCWADDGVYCDPLGRADGREALVAHIAGFHEQMPGNVIEATSGVDEHDGLFRFGWVMRSADGEVLMEGIDFGELADDGRIRRITGFFGPLPTAG